MSNADQFFYFKLGIPKGPFTWTEFAELAKSGVIKSSTRCVRNDNPSQPANIFFADKWKHVEEFIENKRQIQKQAKVGKQQRQQAEREKRQDEAMEAKREAAKQKAREQPNPTPVPVVPAIPPVPAATPPELPVSSNNTTAQRQYTLGLVGSTLLMVGVFLPILRLPIVGSVNYFYGGQGDGVIIIALGLIGVLISASRKYSWLWLPGIGSICIFGFTLTNFYSAIAEAKRQMANELSGNPFRGLGEAMIGSVSLDWGWIVLIAGCVMVCMGAGLKLSR